MTLAISGLAVDLGLEDLGLAETISFGAALLEEDFTGAALAVDLVELVFEEVDLTSGFGEGFAEATVLGFVVVWTDFGLVLVEATGFGFGLLLTGAGAVFGAGITYAPRGTLP